MGDLLFGMKATKQANKSLMLLRRPLDQKHLDLPNKENMQGRGTIVIVQ